LLVNVKEQVKAQTEIRPASGPLVIVKVPRRGIGASVPPKRRKVSAVTVWLEPTGLVSLWGVILVHACNPPPRSLHVSPGCCAKAGGT
jgi:hypothetical protein